MKPLALLLLAGLSAHAFATDPATILQQAEAKEAAFDSSSALRLYQEVDRQHPNQPAILQKIARQYSDLVLDARNDTERRARARLALEYSQRALQLAPNDAVNALSVSIAYGKLALYSGTKDKVSYSRLIKKYADRAVALDPRYAFAHHVLGRWNYEVASLSGPSRFFVKIVYGGLPPASTAEAVKELRLATQLDPGELAHWLELGFALAADNQPAAARKAWQQGLAMPSRHKDDDPAKERARKALGQTEAGP